MEKAVFIASNSSKYQEDKKYSFENWDKDRSYFFYYINEELSKISNVLKFKINPVLMNDNNIFVFENMKELVKFICKQDINISFITVDGFKGITNAKITLDDNDRVKMIYYTVEKVVVDEDTNDYISIYNNLVEFSIGYIREDNLKYLKSLESISETEYSINKNTYSLYKENFISTLYFNNDNGFYQLKEREDIYYEIVAEGRPNLNKFKFLEDTVNNTFKEIIDSNGLSRNNNINHILNLKCLDGINILNKEDNDEEIPF